jgi:TPR repeat protein
VGWNNYLETLEFYPEKGAVWLADASNKGPVNWESVFPQKNDPALSMSSSLDTYINYIRTPLSEIPLEELMRKANSNDKVAQIEIGHRYKSGRDVERNNDLAAVWYQKASRQGSPEADMCIARLNWLGRLNIEPASWENAFMVFERLAYDGSGPSQHYAGLCYIIGRGAKADYSKAAYWFEKSAKNPKRNTYKADSLWELAKLHIQGLGKDKDIAKARDLITQAAELNHAEAKEWLQKNDGNFR